MATQILYSDIDLMFKIHPVKKDLVLSTNEQAIIRSVKNLVLTNHYKRPFRSEVGSNVRKMLFEPLTPLTANYVEKEIYDVLKIYESRITGLNVKVAVSADESYLNAVIQFYINTQTNLTKIDLLLERLR